MAPLHRMRLAKQQAPQRKRKHKEASNHDSVDEVADTSSLPNNTFHNIDTSDSHNSDEHGNESDEDCKKSNSTKYQQNSKDNDDNANNGNSGKHYHWNDIGAISDYISITDQQDSISSLTTETASLTVLSMKSFRWKNSLQSTRN